MDILITGSIAFDYLMTFPGYFRDHFLPERLDKISLSFLVDSMEVQRGGVAPNIAYTLALLGGRPRLWAAVGQDFEEYRAWLEALGVDTRGARTIPGVNTASFFVNTDRSNAQIASFFPGAMAHAAGLSLHELDEPRPELVVISPNDPAAMNRYVGECQALGLPYIYDPSQQIVRLQAEELRAGIRGCLALFVNDYEFALIQKATGWDAEQIFAQARAHNPQAFLVITCGAQGALIYSGDAVLDVPAAPTDKIVDPTGVGDAFRGGFLSGFSHGLDLETCARLGSLSAVYCLEQRGPQAHHYSLDEFAARYRQNYGEGLDFARFAG
jgi:adenosine kinase